jgi:hypothetical protein
MRRRLRFQERVLLGAFVAVGPAWLLAALLAVAGVGYAFDSIDRQIAHARRLSR